MQVRYLHCNLTKLKSHAHIFFVFLFFLLFQMHLAHLKACVTRCMVTIFALVITLVFSWYWSKQPFRTATDVTPNYVNSTEVKLKLSFRSATGVTPNYLNSLTETVFFSPCCGLTHSGLCTSCNVVGNTRQCLFMFHFIVCFICCVLQK